ncbi:MAG: putative ABC transporter related protein [Rhodospirillaceae bacterium]|nr:MAG: putative ABC transporter related protein [Rhodospirillaceae bacterium]
MRARMVKSRKITNQFQVFTAGYEILATAAIFAVIAIMAGEELSTGTFLAFVGAFTMFLSSAYQLARAIVQVFVVKPLYSRAAPIMTTLPETTGNKADPGILTGEFEVSQVAFRYSRDMARVLNGLSITGKPGQFIAVVGPSGSGKSTLMKLLLGFEKPETGAVLLDGRDLRGLDLQLVRRQIGVVLQNGKLMPGTIYENIKGATRASVDDAWDAARMAGLEADIKAMPMGMHTVLTEGGAALSGGQVQRILLARAVVGKPRLLLLDEATSALDNRVPSRS